MDSPQGNRTNEVRATAIAKLAIRGWMSLKEFAAWIGVSQSEAAKMRDAGNFEAIQVGNQWRVYLEEAERFMRKGNRQNDKELQAALRAEGL